MVLNSDVEIATDGQLIGEPTEVALFQAASESGIDHRSMVSNWPRYRERPFDSERRRMTTVHAGPDGLVAMDKGAPEAVLPLCVNALDGEETGPFDGDEADAAATEAAAQGCRVLALARRHLDHPPDCRSADDDIERNLMFLGLMAMVDPPREGVNEALDLCRSAGIRVMMITGDYPATAGAIAARLGMSQAGDRVLTEAKIAPLDHQERKALIPHMTVFARATPEQKIDVVTTL